MFSKSISLAFIVLALSGFSAHAAPRPPAEETSCQSSVSVVTKTVTSTAGSESATAINNEGSGKAAGVTTSAASASETTASSSSTNKKGASTSSTSKSNGRHGFGQGGQSGSKSGNNSGSKKSGSSQSATSTTSDAAATTTAVDNSSGSSAAGNDSGNGSGGDNNNGSGNNDSDPQSSLTLDPRVIADGFEQDGQANATAGQVPSLTSSNNFINFCLTVPNLPITNGKQITTGSCNPAPIGVIPSVDNMPSSKFIFPQNFGEVPANTDFTIKMAVQNFETGNFVNAQTNYFAAPQVLNSGGQIVGHTHFVVEPLTDIAQTKPTDPGTFSFFKGIDAAAVNGVASQDVSLGLPPGVYRLCSINTSANHQPVIVPIAQHGALDDCIYFTAVDNGSAGSTGSNSTASATATESSSASATSAASGNDNGKDSNTNKNTGQKASNNNKSKPNK